jgi:alanine-glyoxylate transaminase / (R)-3-amino-2-methylpropionate-pyruvate transaminase
VGTHLLKRLAKMRDAFPNIVGDVRGKGLMIGVEMVSDAETRTPMQAPHFLEIWEECKDRGVLIGRGGLHGNVSIIFLTKNWGLFVKKI